MFGKLFLLGLLALAQARPQDELVYEAPRCPSGVSNYLIPNEKDCSRFYICGMGRSMGEGVCEPGLEFSIELQRCADPLVAKCNCNPDPDTTTSAPAPTPAPVPEEEREIIYLDNGCPEDMHVPKLLPHEERCEYYYHCDKGEKVLRECADGTYFVYEDQTCDSALNVNCISNGTTTPRPTTVKSTTVEEESYEITYLPNGCPADGSYLLLPHETICRKFYYCVHGEKVERECRVGAAFNPAIMNCDHASNVDCEDVVTECICDVSDEDCDGSTTTPVPASGEQVGSGENNESEEKQESGENDESAEKQESDEKIESSEKQESEEKDESAEKQESEEKNESAEKQESEETDESAEKQESEETDESAEKQESEETDESAETPVTTAKPDSSENNKSEENTESGEEKTSCENNDSDEKDESHECNCEDSDEEEDLRCKEDCHVPFWAHETDCDKFWRCVGEEKVLGVCSEGLHFNEETQTCDFICNVGCKRNHVQSTALREGVKLFLPWNKVDDLFRDSPKMAMKFLKHKEL